MLLTVSGPPGGGKTTNAELLADEFGFEHVSGGDIFRQLADERGYTPLEFNKLAEENDQIDRDLDRRLREIAVEREDLVLESRLAGWLAAEQADLKFWLDAPLAVRGERIAEREEKTPERAMEETRAREASEVHRYREYYGIEFDDLSIYDLSVNTARWGPESVADMLVTAVEAYDSRSDEGKTPVDIDAEF
ncbi:(d)CMP kinase [Natrialbaceae archaeon A-CW2]|uniref:Cytidylate kinase n=1 Tax=Natronosalvus hydrolyticus TaxID=2979988 RepID=A0AAP3E6T9_9EURY|nr:AAA family ATPase [Natronosalvus amylolyticus]MCU4752846.1 AAA family ATPase [Halobacteria archaeon AArc-curdl1]